MSIGLFFYSPSEVEKKTALVYEYETWSLKLSVQHRLKVFESMGNEEDMWAQED